MHTLIVGSGLAGWSVARELRKLLPDAAANPITLVCADSGDVYPKPSLSNALVAKKAAAQLVGMPAERAAAGASVTLVPHTRVDAIDRAAKTVKAGDQAWAYDQLVLALGADPVRLKLEGDGADSVLSVNDLADYAGFRAVLEAIESARRVVVLGAGLIGCEFANDLAATGHQVDVFDLITEPLGRLLPPQAGAFLRERMAAGGVKWHLGQSVVKVEKAEGGALRVTGSGGSVVEADLVLSAVGLRPRTQLAQAAGLAVGAGVQVDRQLRTSDAAIHALGDCAEVEGLVLPYIQPIMHASRVTAAALAGQGNRLSYPAMPVIVKTPLCPTVVAPPAKDAAGAWKVEPTEAGLVARFESAEGALLGFALLGDATSQRAALAQQLPPVLA